jgi:glucosamine-6-phosphate deaminase
VHSPNGVADDIFTAAEDYDALIAADGPVDVQLLGIGVNGHIGFNEPGSSLASRTRVKTLTEQTRHDNARFFAAIDDVPRHVITQGLGTIRDARHLVLIAAGDHKAEAIAAAVEGPLTASRPASVLQLHPHVTVVVDEAAAGQLKNADFYRYALKHKPAHQKY